MPANACVAFYDCKGCGKTLKPLPGSCCVFCSYGSVPCPPIQQGVEPWCTSAARQTVQGLAWQYPHQPSGVVGSYCPYRRGPVRKNTITHGHLDCSSRLDGSCLLT